MKKKIKRERKREGGCTKVKEEREGGGTHVRARACMKKKMKREREKERGDVRK
jgi:hypothetical protein